MNYIRLAFLCWCCCQFMGARTLEAKPVAQSKWPASSGPLGVWSTTFPKPTTTPAPILASTPATTTVASIQEATTTTTTDYLGTVSSSSDDELTTYISTRQVDLDGPSPNGVTSYHRDDYFESEAEFQQLLQLLTLLESENSIMNDRANYVPEDANLAEILRLIGTHDNNGLEAASTTPPIAGYEHPVSNSHDSSISSNQDGLQRGSDGGQNETVAAEIVCPICLETMKSSGTIWLDCAHGMHAKCAMDWVRASANTVWLERINCPICRHRTVFKPPINYRY